jgi:hypothetical protein
MTSNELAFCFVLILAAFLLGMRYGWVLRGDKNG